LPFLNGGCGRCNVPAVWQRLQVTLDRALDYYQFGVLLKMIKMINKQRTGAR
jgi:hypothetical protein